MTLFHTLPAWLRRDAHRAWVRPVVVGVVNVTPDSFSDGGVAFGEHAAQKRIDLLIEEQADVIELGGESTRPKGQTYGEGFMPVAPEEQRRRILPALRYARAKHPGLVAIDTASAQVAEAALDEGADIINDVSMLRDPMLAKICAQYDAWLVLMHAREGAASTYTDLLSDLRREWTERFEVACSQGVSPQKIVFDPGLGFGKGPEDNRRIVVELGSFRGLGAALYVGASRKSFLAYAEKKLGLSPSEPQDRDTATAVAHLHAAKNGAEVLRVHSVKAMLQALAIEHFLGEAQTL